MEKLATTKRLLCQLGGVVRCPAGRPRNVSADAAPPDPQERCRADGLWYVFGSASLTLLMVQILTGIGLALVYVPAADEAYNSLLYLNYEAPFGWFLRALHYYAGSAWSCWCWRI